MSLTATTAAAAFLGFQATAATFFTFQVPNCPGASPTAINNNGVVTGYCGNGNGFVREPGGHFILFHVGVVGTFPTAINNNGNIAGYYIVNLPPPLNGLTAALGFIRPVQGPIITFGEQPAGSESFFVNSINDHGDVVGGDTDGGPQTKLAFLRADQGGALVGFDFNLIGSATAFAINDNGEIGGSSFDLTNFAPQGFVLEPNGSGGYTKRNVGPPAFASFVVGLNRSGAVLGVFAPVPGPANQGFIETATGQISVFPLPNPMSIVILGGGPLSILQIGGGINAHGAAVLCCGIGANNLVVPENIYRAPDGAITNIAVGNCTGVLARSLNDHGWVTGSCTLGGQGVGFLWRK